MNLWIKFVPLVSMTTYNMLYRRGYKTSPTSSQGATRCAFLRILRWYVSTFYVSKNCQLIRYQLSLSIKRCNMNVRCKVNKGSITSFWVSVGQEGKATRTPCVSHSYDSLFHWHFHVIYLRMFEIPIIVEISEKNVRFILLTAENYKL